MTRLPTGRLRACAAALSTLLLAAVIALDSRQTPVHAQDAAGDTSTDNADRRLEEALASETAEDGDATAALETEEEQPSINLLDLVFRGGWLVVPILLMSLVVVGFGIERGLALRRAKIMPAELIDGLSESAQQGSFDPRKAYRLCQQYPSTAATVIRSMLLKVGRPHSEVEHAVQEASEREAAQLYSNVRPLNLAAAISPLMGLLGTVWGMINAFFVTSHLGAGVNKAQQLADGIYVALVTTAVGLAVAIPAAVLAHYFEGRIQMLLREIEELLFNLLPHVERYEGKLRVSRHALGSEPPPPPPENGAADSAAAEPAARKRQVPTAK